jgi:hypothetical protein
MEEERPTKRQHSRSSIVCKVEEKSGEVVLQVQVVLSGAEDRRRGRAGVLLTCGLLWAVVGDAGKARHGTMARRRQECALFAMFGGVVQPSGLDSPVASRLQDPLWPLPRPCSATSKMQAGDLLLPPKFCSSQCLNVSELSSLDSTMHLVLQLERIQFNSHFKFKFSIFETASAVSSCIKT